jgi:DNA polymerase-3 subunit alpha
MAALLTADRENTAKVVRYITECKEMGLQVLPPDVNESDVDFTAVSDTEVRFGLSAIKGVGRGAVESLLEARRRVGRFRSLYSFCAEIDLRLNNKKVLEALIKAGALDSLADGQGSGRSSLMFSLDRAVEHAQARRADREAGQASLFGEPAGDAPRAGQELEPGLPAMPEWPREDRLRHEKEVLGFYVSGHPLQQHAEVLASLTTAPLADLAEHSQREVTVAGIVTAMRRLRTRRGDWMALFTLEDLTGHAEIVAFPETWKACERLVATDAVLCVRGKVELGDEVAKVLASSVDLLGRAEQAAARGLLVRLPDGLSPADLQATLGLTDDLLSERPGTCPVTFELPVPDLGLVRVLAGARFRVTPEKDLLASLERIVGPGRVSLVL